MSVCSARRTTSTYTANGADLTIVWGAQLEAGAFPTSYIPTTSAAVVRYADVATMTGTRFSQLSVIRRHWLLSGCAANLVSRLLQIICPSGTYPNLQNRRMIVMFCHIGNTNFKYHLQQCIRQQYMSEQMIAQYCQFKFAIRIQG